MANWLTRLLQIQPEQPKTEQGKKPLTGEIAVSDPYEMFSNGKDAFIKYNPDELISRKGISFISKMRRDDQIKICMAFKKHSALASGWTIKSPDDKPDDWEVTEFVKTTLKGIKGGLDKALKEMLTGLEYGYSITEKNFGDKDGKFVIKELKVKHPSQMMFASDEFANLKWIEQAGRKLQPMEKFVVYVNNMEFGNWYGKTDLAEAYRAYWTKDNAYKWLAMLLEKNGIPPVIVLYDQNVYTGNVLTRLQSIIKNMQAATSATIPREGKDSLELWTPEIANNVQNVFIPAMNMFNIDIARALLMPGLLGATPDQQQGSYARSKTHFDIFLLTIEDIRTYLAESIVQEQIVKQLVDLNFAGITEYPKFEFLPIDDKLRIDILDQWTKLTEKGVVTKQLDDEKHIRELVEFPELSQETLDEIERDKEAKDLAKNQNNGAPTGTPQLDSKGNPIADNDAGSNTELDDLKADGKNLSPQKTPPSASFSLKKSRSKTAYEKKIDFAAIDKTIKLIEVDLITELRNILKGEQDYLIEKIKKESSDYNTITVRSGLTTSVFSTLKNFMLLASEEGYTNVATTVKKSFASVNKKPKPGYVAKQADKWLVSRARNVSGVMSSTLDNGLTIILSNAIKNGTVLGEVISQVQDLFLPYIGNDNIIEDDEVISPNRVETIVRTNTTQAYNQGRLVAMRDPDIAIFMSGVQYSAILDERTTSICEHLDGKVFRVDDSDLDRLTPPNHFNCRSILVPVMLDEKIEKGDFIKPSEKGKAVELAGKGFV